MGGDCLEADPDLRRRARMLAAASNRLLRGSPEGWSFSAVCGTSVGQHRRLHSWGFTRLGDVQGMARRPGALTLSEEDRRGVGVWGAGRAERGLAVFGGQAPGETRPPDARDRRP